MPLRRTARACAFVSSVACVLAQGEAHAAPRLRWTAPAQCPAAAEVEADVERLLGGAPLDEVWPDALEAEGSVTRGPSGWRVRVVTVTADGRSERRLTGATCREVAEAAALLVAVAVDSSAAAEAPPPAEVAPAPLPAPAPAQPPAPAPTKAPAFEAPRAAVEAHVDPAASFVVTARVAAAVQAGGLPEATPGLGLAAGVSSGAFRLEADFATWAGSTAALSDGAGAELDLSWAGLRGCASIGTLRPRIEACLGGIVGWADGTAYGVSRPASGGSVLVAPEAGLLARFPLPASFAIAAGLAAAVPLQKPSFRMEGHGVVYEPSPVFGHAFLGIERSLP